MHTVRGVLAWAILIGTAGLSGCGKKVDLVFYNATTSFVEITLDCPADGPRSVGTVGPYAAHVYGLRLDKDLLPVECRWHAAGLSGQFALAQDSPERVYIYIEHPPVAEQIAPATAPAATPEGPAPSGEPAPLVPEGPLPVEPVEPLPPYQEPVMPPASAEDV